MAGNDNDRAGTRTGSLEEHNLFREVTATLETLKVPYWLDQGTLLGIIREGRLLRTDHDLDLGLWGEDYLKNRGEILRCLQKKGRFIETYKPHQLTVTDLEGKFNMINLAFYRCEEGRAVKDVCYPVAGPVVKVLINTVLFCAHAREGTVEQKFAPGMRKTLSAAVAKIIPVPLWNILCYSAGRSQYYFRPFFKMAVDEKYFLNLETITLAGRKLPVPGNPQEYLALKYGPDWRVPRDRWLYWQDDGAISP